MGFIIAVQNASCFFVFLLFIVRTSDLGFCSVQSFLRCPIRSDGVQCLGKQDLGSLG